MTNTTPEAVARFSPRRTGTDVSMRLSPVGDWVKISDYAALSAQLAECEARLLKVTAEREEENLKFQMANTAWDQETATRKVAEALAAFTKEPKE